MPALVQRRRDGAAGGIVGSLGADRTQLLASRHGHASPPSASTCQRHMGTSNYTLMLRFERRLNSVVAVIGVGMTRLELFLRPACRCGGIRPNSTQTPPANSYSCRRCRHPLKLHQPAHVVDQVHHADLHRGARDADGPHELAAHRVFLMAEHMLDTGASPWACRVGRRLALRQWMVAVGPPMDAALVTLGLELGLDLRRPIGAIGPHVR